ncbi:cupin domain-containing protein [Protofrankia symbiont of Coriaria ruscifolia]|uniref:cupin domain-containing protein n=1 Tax=Protofrankia symbiont of Coriaria ruscifolia TaxID=1306542 RepID=UPI001040E9E4|nr:cupin domain-containing protein [Protofrankia symbiont of Coriaria ruscifolia]
MRDQVVRDVFRSGFEMPDLTWSTWVEPGRSGVEHHVLWAPDDTGEDSVGLILRFPPGAHGDFHEHLGYELMLVLDGTLDHSDGRSFGFGDLVVEGPGTRHQMSSRQGCTVLAIRSRPAAAREPSTGEIRRPVDEPATGCTPATYAQLATPAAEGPVER